MSACDPKAPATAEQLAAIDFAPLPAAEAKKMYRDFSAKPWTAEYNEHGFALRLAYMLMIQTKEKIVDGVEQTEREYSGTGAGPTAELIENLEHSKKRLSQLVKIIEAAERRLLSAAAVVELRHSGGAA
jgi:hypothetical protein